MSGDPIWTRRGNYPLESWSWQGFTARKETSEGMWNLSRRGEHLGSFEYLQTAMRTAQGMSTGTAKTPKADEGRSPASPVPEGQAPK